ncbi:hypothetical protein [uncultured Endozoicomonas sp.]|uniref:hypothetical protein n=1 Tax=uncultured Endozoicomonas sp. TaxID=432652 RepID=UPI002619882D|nr:hypothetical protein [uncultured Endozoicomonas sp.]
MTYLRPSPENEKMLVEVQVFNSEMDRDLFKEKHPDTMFASVYLGSEQLTSKCYRYHVPAELSNTGHSEYSCCHIDYNDFRRAKLSAVSAAEDYMYWSK